MWCNDVISSVWNVVEFVIWEIYKIICYLIVYKVLKWYFNYEKEDVEEFYEKFFNEFFLN